MPGWVMTSGSYRMPPTPPAAPIAPLLDTYPSAAVAYSFRKLRATYAGSAVRIRRSSDNGELDVGFSGNDFDAAAAATHIGGGSGFIVTWYDQSGNGKDATQATAGLQPSYIALGVGGLPSVSWPGAHVLGTAAFDLTAVTGGMTATGTVFAAVKDSTTNAQKTLYTWGGLSVAPSTTCLLPNSGTLFFDIGDNVAATSRVTVAQPGGFDNTEHLVELFRDSSDNQSITIDGVDLVNLSRGQDLVSASKTLFIGDVDATGGSRPYSGYMAELIIWGTDLGGVSRTAVRTNINTYYNTIF
jgi:hypothetical protein